jgi:hypothetical protein
LVSQPIRSRLHKWLADNIPDFFPSRRFARPTLLNPLSKDPTYTSQVKPQRTGAYGHDYASMPKLNMLGVVNIGVDPPC